ncbi:glutathione peroxidase [Planctobacterium marinum]|uniref:Glutathione peroxidase n=1 Tax=Planctobacterium marinum TaxID=1631968 RepID=A0AA48HG13_9ALTE|nr:glutathione peroxidase [Planctobacterium marinum]
MKKILSLILFSVLSVGPVQASDCAAPLKHLKRKLNSQETVNLCAEFGNKAVLIVNTASYCGFTPQFEGLEALYSEYKDKGLVVLGFPSHDFNQEDEDEAKTAELCELTYGVKFPMFEPLHVRGDDADPLFRQLAKATGTAPKWNFYKYLIDSDGKNITSYTSYTKPQDQKFIDDINSALPK